MKKLIAVLCAFGMCAGLITPQLIYAEEPAAAKLSWLRRVYGGLSAEDRYSRLHAGTDRAHRKDSKLD